MIDEELYQKFFSIWCRMIDNGMYEEAARIDMMQYNEQIRKNESLSVWTRWQNDTADKRKFLVCIADQINPITGPISEGSVNVALVYHNFSGLAHETQLARNIEFLRQHGAVVNIHVVYAFGEASTDKVEKAASIHNVPESNIHFMCCGGYTDVGISLGYLDVSMKFKTIIYPSEYYLAYWASLTLAHSNQKFLSLKYYPLQIGRFSDYAGLRGDKSIYGIVNGQSWRQLSILDIFSKFNFNDFDYWGAHQNPRYFGSISRIEKACDNNYLNFVHKILCRHEAMEYLYFGAESSLYLIDDKIRMHPRAKFLGWANPDSAVKALSIYIETFPWGGGEMSLLAIKAGIPYLCLATDENKMIGMCRFLMSIAGNDPSGVASEIFCNSESELNEKFDKMIASKNYRESLRQAWLNIINNYCPIDIESWKEFMLC